MRSREEAFQRALELNPDLSIAHNLYTIVEVETGRARQAMLRLLERAPQRVRPTRNSSPGSCRRAATPGLERPAIAAHEHARRLDPQIRTAVAHAYLAAGDYERVDRDRPRGPAAGDGLAMDLLGRRDEAIAYSSVARRRDADAVPPHHRGTRSPSGAATATRRAWRPMR